MSEGREPVSDENQFGRNVHSSALTMEMIPRDSADGPAISTFALTFDGYAVWGDQTGAIANGILEEFKNGGPLPQDIRLLRTALFFEQRRYHHFGWAPGRAERKYIDALLSALRRAVAAGGDRHAGDE